MPQSGTEVHPHESNSPLVEDTTPWGMPVSSSDPAVIWRHSGWQRERALIRSALERTATSTRNVTRFMLCGCDPWVARDPEDPDRLSIQVNACRSRWCVPCSQSRGSRIEHHLTNLLKESRSRFLTLTIRPHAQPLRAELERLYSAFQRLRRTRLWRDCVEGGAVVLEVVHSQRGEHWHPHLHVVCQGKYIPHAALSAHWHAITGDSFVVHITLAKFGNDAARYLAKYLRKPVDRTIVNKPDKLDELIRALRGRRMLTTFGTWRGFRLTKPIDPTKWELCIPLDELIYRAARGIEDACRDLATLSETHPAWIRLYNDHPP